MAKNWRLVFREVDRINYERVRSGVKSIETRAATVKYQPIKAGDTLTFACGKDTFTKTITKVHHWPSVDAMLKDIPLKSVMPELEMPEQAKKVYASYPGYEEKIRQHGLLGFEMA